MGYISAKCKRGRSLTIGNNEEVYSKYRETLADSVVCILKFPLHNRSVDFDKDNASQSSDNHPSNFRLADSHL